MYENSYTLKTLPGLITNTYVLAVILAIIFIGISMLISNMIAYQGGKNPSDPRKRKIWFFVLSGVAIISFFLWNFLHVAGLVKGAPAQSEFLIHNAISTGVVLVVYIVLGIVLSKILKKGKYGTLFSSKSN